MRTTPRLLRTHRSTKLLVVRILRGKGVHHEEVVATRPRLWRKAVGQKVVGQKLVGQAHVE